MVGSGSIGGGGGGFSTLGDGPDERPYERDENGSRRREQERERESVSLHVFVTAHLLPKLRVN
jgi:hypothetical protein